MWPILTNLYLHWSGSLWKALFSTTPLPERLSVHTRKALHKETVAKLLIYWILRNYLLLVSKVYKMRKPHGLLPWHNSPLVSDKFWQTTIPWTWPWSNFNWCCRDNRGLWQTPSWSCSWNCKGALIRESQDGWRRKEHVDADVPAVSNFVLFLLWVWQLNRFERTEWWLTFMYCLLFFCIFPKFSSSVIALKLGDYVLS